MYEVQQFDRRAKKSSFSRCRRLKVYVLSNSLNPAVLNNKHESVGISQFNKSMWCSQLSWV